MAFFCECALQHANGRFRLVIEQIVQKGIHLRKNGYYRRFAERIEISDGPSGSAGSKT